MLGVQAVTHLKMYVGVEYLCPEAHGRRLQRVLLRHVERQLKRAALKRRVSGPLRVKLGRLSNRAQHQNTAHSEHFGTVQSKEPDSWLVC